MRVMENGVLAPSQLYFHTPSEEAKGAFFYPICAGDYLCDGQYAVSRSNYDSFLLIYVKRGSGYFEIHGRRTTVSQGAFLLINCYEPHCYGTHDGWHIDWMHFDGVTAMRYYEIIRARGNECIYPSKEQLRGYALETMTQTFHGGTPAGDAALSQQITNLLMLLLTHGEDRQKGKEQIREVLQYISNHLNGPLDLQELAKKASFSPYYLIRVFKKETGRTPHEYIVNARIGMAKFYLKTTAIPIEQVAARCGFTYPSSFCTAFKRVTQTTPKEYREQRS